MSAGRSAATLAINLIVNARRAGAQFNAINRNFDQMNTRANRFVGIIASIGLFATGLFTIQTVFQNVTRLLADFVGTAADFESRFTRVQKTTDATNQEIARLQQELFGTSQAIRALDTRKLIDITAVAGQLGIRGAENLNKFAFAAGTASTLLEGIADESIVRGLGGIILLFDESADQALSLTSVLDDLENTTKATAGELVQITERVAEFADRINLSRNETLAFSATLKDLRVRTQIAGSGLIRLFQTIERRPEAISDFLGITVDELSGRLSERGGTAGVLLEFFEKLQTLPLSQQQQLLKDLELSGVRVSQVLTALGRNTDVLRESIKTANDAATDFDGLLERTGNIADDTTSRIQDLKNAWNEFKVSLTDTGAFDKAITSLSLLLRFVGTDEGKSLLGNVGSGLLDLAGIPGGAVGAKAIGGLSRSAQGASDDLAREKRRSEALDALIAQREAEAEATEEIVKLRTEEALKDFSAELEKVGENLEKAEDSLLDPIVRIATQGNRALDALQKQFDSLDAASQTENLDAFNAAINATIETAKIAQQKIFDIENEKQAREDEINAKEVLRQEERLQRFNDEIDVLGQLNPLEQRLERLRQRERDLLNEGFGREGEIEDAFGRLREQIIDQARDRVAEDRTVTPRAGFFDILGAFRQTQTALTNITSVEVKELQKHTKLLERIAKQPRGLRA